jgi:hypothetical protein
MAHFAKVNDKGIVTTVIVAEQDFIDSYVDTEPGRWVQTSYNTHGGVHYDPNTESPSADQSKALRKNYACKGMIYDLIRDAFYSPQPFPSWVLNETTCVWEPPIPLPNTEDPEVNYRWDESSQSWIEED